MLENSANLPCAVILTALPIEYQAVRPHLTRLRKETHPQGTIYQRGIFTSQSQLWDVGIVEIGAGNVGAAFEAERAINYFKPIIILFVGVAGGLKDVRLGDVVVATKVYGYESGKANITFQTRPEVANSTYRMEQYARSVAREDDWLRRIGSSIPEPAPKVFVAPIAAGEKVVGSTRSATWKFLKENYGDALAVEMEGYGFLRVAHANRQVEAIIIRGISDCIDDKTEANAAKTQELAARHAGAFSFEVLAQLGEDRGFFSPQADTGTGEKSNPQAQTTQNTGKYVFNIKGNVHQSTVGDNPQVTINYGNKPQEK